MCTNIKIETLCTYMSLKSIIFGSCFITIFLNNNPKHTISTSHIHCAVLWLRSKFISIPYSYFFDKELPTDIIQRHAAFKYVLQ